MCVTTSDMRCPFPFKYEGIDFNSCTRRGNGNTPWCATSVKSDGTYDGWGYCDVEKCLGACTITKCHSGNCNTRSIKIACDATETSKTWFYKLPAAKVTQFRGNIAMLNMITSQQIASFENLSGFFFENLIFSFF